MTLHSQTPIRIQTLPLPPSFLRITHLELAGGYFLGTDVVGSFRHLAVRIGVGVEIDERDAGVFGGLRDRFHGAGVGGGDHQGLDALLNQVLDLILLFDDVLLTIDDNQLDVVFGGISFAAVDQIGLEGVVDVRAGIADFNFGAGGGRDFRRSLGDEAAAVLVAVVPSAGEQAARPRTRPSARIRDNSFFINFLLRMFVGVQVGSNGC
jgi:hypothetical protein